MQLYKVLLNVMIQVIDIKENWDDNKYTQSQVLINHRIFKNKFLGEWVEFAIKQAKIVYNLYLQTDTVLFSHIVLPDVIKLLYKVLIFSYESPNIRSYEWLK